MYKNGDYVVNVVFNPAHWVNLRGFALTTSKAKIISKYVGGSHTDRDRWLMNVKK